MEEQQDIFDDEIELKNKPVRPLAISMLCALGFIGAAVAIIYVLSEVIGSSFYNWYVLYLGISAALGLTCLIGLWNMKKWAVYCYTGLVSVNQIIAISLNIWNPIVLILPIILIVVSFKNLDKMN